MTLSRSFSELKMLTDAQLIEEIRADTPYADKVLFDRHFQNLRQYVKTKMNNRGPRTATDIAQSAMAVAFDGFIKERYNVHGKSTIWKLIRTIAFHKIVNTSRRPEPTGIVAPEQIAQTINTELDSTMQELCHQIREKLTKRRQKVFDLLLEGGWKVCDIAKEVGVSEKNVYLTRKHVQEAFLRFLQQQ